MGARSQAEARAYFTGRLRRSWGILAVREFAQHRIRRVCYVGSGHKPRAAQAKRPVDAAAWEMRDPTAPFGLYGSRAPRH